MLILQFSTILYFLNNNIFIKLTIQRTCLPPSCQVALGKGACPVKSAAHTAGHSPFTGRDDSKSVYTHVFTSQTPEC